MFCYTYVKWSSITCSDLNLYTQKNMLTEITYIDWFSICCKTDSILLIDLTVSIACQNIILNYEILVVRTIINENVRTSPNAATCYFKGN